MSIGRSVGRSSRTVLPTLCQLVSTYRNSCKPAKSSLETSQKQRQRQRQSQPGKRKAKLSLKRKNSTESRQRRKGKASVLITKAQSLAGPGPGYYWILKLKLCVSNKLFNKYSDSVCACTILFSRLVCKSHTLESSR